MGKGFINNLLWPDLAQYVVSAIQYGFHTEFIPLYTNDGYRHHTLACN